MNVLTAIENSGFGLWVRESGSVWSYPTIIFLHSLGLAILVGANMALDLRLLGFAPGLPVAALEKLFPVMWTGFWINAASGVALSIADATTMLVSPLFYFKMALVAGAVIVMVAIRRRAFLGSPPGDRLIPPGVRLLALASLGLWTGAIVAGRLTAYVGPAVALAGR
jgi:hypothetical protein